MTAGLLARLHAVLDAGPADWGAEQQPHVRCATLDAIRNFALGTGDDDPRWVGPHTDPTTVVAPPLFLLATGTPVEPTQPLPDDLRRQLRRGARIGAERWTFHEAIRAGDVLDRRDQLVAVGPGAAPGAFEVTQVTTWWRGGAAVGERHRDRRYGAPAPGPPPADRARYRAEEVAEIEAAQISAGRRGANTRTVAEVEVGASVPLGVRGPLTATDLMSYRAAVGPGPLDAGAGPIRHRNRAANPELFSLDASGAWDTIERVHWDDAYARSQGHPAAWDYSHMRTVWLASALADWGGDGASMDALAVTTAGHVYVGDTQWLSGTVTAVDDPVEVAGRTDRPGTAVVHLALASHDQRGARTAWGAARLRLPAPEPTGAG